MNLAQQLTSLKKELVEANERVIDAQHALDDARYLVEAIEEEIQDLQSALFHGES